MPTHNPKRPNVLLICTDHWPGSLLCCSGHPVIHTPTLDQIAANGIRFPNATSECPVCIPARRTLMTGLSPHGHGILQNQNALLPDVPTLAEVFRDAGYQTSAVGKLHVYPQRRRLGFEEVLLDEEGRTGGDCRSDDYEIFLGDNGHPGRRFAGGMSNNGYIWRPWHLPEFLHATNWAASQMCRQIFRRDPLRPAFWYLSFSHPHPPLTPLRDYLELYRSTEPPAPVVGKWVSGDTDCLPPPLQRIIREGENLGRSFRPEQIVAIRRAFYALCTHIDHQIRIVLGTLRQEGLLGNTIICFTSDHGDMLGEHRMWAKSLMYQPSVGVPMILSGTEAHRAEGRVSHHITDTRLVGLADVMPTLLDLAGIEIPSHCQGRSMIDPEPRKELLGAFGHAINHPNPSRMLRDPRHKLVYYPLGNHFQLFDLDEDPHETIDLSNDSSSANKMIDLRSRLAEALPADECALWLDDQRNFRGIPAVKPLPPKPNPNFEGQRGLQWP